MAALSSKTRTPFFRFIFGLHSLFAVGLALILLVVVNYMSYRHHARVDISSSGFYTLSEKTHAVIEGISNRVDVIVYVQPGRTGYDDIINLLDQYSAVQPLIRVTRIDPDRDIARAEQLAAQYDVDGSNLVVFDMGGRSSVIPEDRLFKLDKSPLKEGEMPRKVQFLGEQHFTSALQSIISGVRPKLYFLQGHGEGDPFDFDSRSGFSKCAAALERDNIEVLTLKLGEVQKIPEDCDGLIIAGPTERLSSLETALIDDYLQSNGSVLMMLESMRDVGLRPLLRRWGVTQGEDIVVDQSRTISGRELFITKYQFHPITAGMAGKSSIFYLPCSIEPIRAPDGIATAADRPNVSILATSSSKGWAESDWMNTPMEFNPETERGGALSVAVAIERGAGSSLQVASTRMVVFGDSDFVSNAGMAGANIDLFLNSVDWLLEREDLIAISPKEFGETKLVLSRRQILWLGGALVLGLPFLFALSGFIVWLFRRY